MTLTNGLTRYAVGVCVGLVVLDGCTGAATMPPIRPGSIQQPVVQARQKPESAGYVYVSNRTDQDVSQLLVYPAEVQNPAPIRTISLGLVDVAGIAVDPAGDVYVANGRAGNVLEFGPGGTSLVQTYSKGLCHPIDVTVANGTLYVADQGNTANGYSQQVMEYATGDGTPTIGIAGLGDTSEMNEAIAVDPLAAEGTFFSSASSQTEIPPSRTRPNSATYFFAENILPTLWMDIPLSNSRQASGVAFDPNGNLYVSDVTTNEVAIYHLADYTWMYSGRISGTFNAPLFLTINNQFLAIPSAASSGSHTPGYVTVIDQTGHLSQVTISSNLQHPIGAAVVAGS